MKKLFCVKDLATSKMMKSQIFSGDGYFDNKKDAKKVRDSFGGVEIGYVVSRGPDNLPSPTGVPRMRRQPKGQE